MDKSNYRMEQAMEAKWENDCPARDDGGWHKFENVFMMPADSCLYCGISTAVAWAS